MVSRFTYDKVRIFFLVIVSLQSIFTSEAFSRRGKCPGETLDGTRIAWDHTSERIIAPEGGGYARVLRLQDGSYAAVYESGGRAMIRRSYDSGSTWTDRQLVVDAYDKDGVRVYAVNSEIFQLSDGTLLYGVNFRPSKEEVEPWSVAVARSEDGGANWSDAEIIYRAQPRFRDGCWEPYFLEMPDGSIHVYFANEGPYTNSSEQEIACMISRDSGRTWGEYRTVSFRAGHRDGMPVARIFNDEIVVAIEDNAHGEFVPYTVRCPLSDVWSSPVYADSRARDYALADSLHHDGIYGGAPYLLKLPDGDAAMSYQRSYRKGRWDLDRMEVVIGDRNARNFARPSYPFDVPDGKSCMWNSICLLDDHTIGAVGTLNVGGVFPVFKKGYLMYDLRVQKGDIEQLPVFIGAEGQTQLRAGVALGQSCLKFKVEVADADVCSAGEESDGVTIYLAPSASTDGTFRRVMKLWVSHSGDVLLWQWKDGSWHEVDSGKVDIRASRTSAGYVLDLALPRSVTGRLDKDAIRLGMTLHECCDGKIRYEEDLADMKRDAPSTWLPFSLHL